MYVRNSLCSGDFLTVVPVGLPLTLQYDARGILERVYQGYDSDRVDISLRILSTFRSQQTLPIKIPIIGGTTWVKGVLYTSETYYSEGELPDAISDDIILAYVDHPNKFNFFAGNAESLATVFRGAAPIRNWLSMAKFNVLPGWVISGSLTRDQFIKMIDTENYTFKFPLIMSYMIYRKQEMLYMSTKLKQFVAHKITRYTDDNGYIKAKLITKSKSFSMSIDYSDVIKFNIQPDSLIVLDCYGSIIYVMNTKKRDKVESTICCDTCGKSFNVIPSDVVMCPDVHCMSRAYATLIHFLDVLRLPRLDKCKYDEYVSKGDLTCIPDVLQIEEYCNSDISVTLVQILSAIVPVNIVSNYAVFSAFANRCNNNVRSFKYYIHHPHMIYQDLQLSSNYSDKFIQWLDDPCNVLDIDALLDSPQISVVETNKKFDGAPIFRGKSILLTGDFKHGSHSDIESILKSYSATVVTEFSENVHCVITGSTMENINGTYIRNARNLGIPVYDEMSFFNAYEIDKDLSENL